MFYIFIEDNKINGAGQCRQLTEGVVNFEVSEELFYAFIDTPDKYMWSGENVVENPDYEEIIKQKERERISLLSLTAADVERAIYKAKGIDFDDIIELVKDNPMIDLKALKIELKANNFYRGNPYVEQIGTLLGYTSADIDYLFENGELPNADTADTIE